MKLMFSLVTVLFVTLQLCKAAAGAGGWELVFLADQGTGDVVYDKWVNPPSNPPCEDTSCACSWRQQLPCLNCTWKSDKVDAWANVKEVKVAYYTNCTEVAFIVFNAAGKDKMNWFDVTKVTSSSWTSLTSTSSALHPQFSLKGHGSILRRFFAAKNYGGCPNDRFWMLVVDSGPLSKHPCDYDHTPNVYPHFYYNPTGSASLVRAIQMPLADTFTIYIR
ncbi:uncharacterized protein LOC141914673 [Tubulanus polymorphus]|uniref:uncharacterized protein LOC141914673 n=1 Tax=Tubulanus polymorphus TaxID=672921 RepID=UPI003DA64AFA